MSNLVAGPRQTIDRVVHPQRGDGIAVRDNGPEFFQADGGEAIPMRVQWGGASKDESWSVLVDPQYGRVRAKLIRRGDRHQRMWSPMLGPGWLVWLHVPDAIHAQWEGDDGRESALIVNVLAVGTPAWWTKHGRKKRPPEYTDEEREWTTLTLDDGSVMGMRRGGPPPAQASETLPGVAR